MLSRVVDLKKRKTVASIKNLGSGIISLDCQKRGQISKEYFATDIKMQIDCFLSTSRIEKNNTFCQYWHKRFIVVATSKCILGQLNSFLVSKNFGIAYKMHDCQVNFWPKSRNLTIVQPCKIFEHPKRIEGRKILELEVENSWKKKCKEMLHTNTP